VVVGVNAYREQDLGELPFEIHRVDPETETRMVADLAEFRVGRGQALVERRLEELRSAASSEENVMPATIEAVRARATGGEIVEALRAVHGSYVETVVF
jgi:methylmalonyl-CoA mutase N-terminal domain/subunit